MLQRWPIEWLTKTASFKSSPASDTMPPQQSSIGQKSSSINQSIAESVALKRPAKGVAQLQLFQLGDGRSRSIGRKWPARAGQKRCFVPRRRISKRKRQQKLNGEPWPGGTNVIPNLNHNFIQSLTIRSQSLLDIFVVF